MRCGWRFGKSFLRDGLGSGHLTERQPAGRPRNGRPGACSTGESDGQEHDAEASHRGEPESLRTGRRGPPTQGHGNGGLGSGLPVLARSERGRCRHGLGLGAVDLQARRGPPLDLSGASGASHSRDGSDPFSFRCRHPQRHSHGGRSRASAFPSGAPCARRGPPWARRRARNAHRLGRRRSDRYRRLRRPRLRLTGGPRRKKRERIEVAVRVGGQADAEVDVGLRPFHVAARADRAHHLALLDRRARSHADRPEMDQRDGISVGRPDRETEPLMRELPDEGDDARGRGANVRTGRRGDVDSTVLAAGVGVVLGDERPQHGAVDWPSPGTRARAQNETEQDGGREYERFVALFDNHERPHYRADRPLSNVATASRGTGGSAESR
jgi:hypothetical protein